MMVRVGLSCLWLTAIGLIGCSRDKPSETPVAVPTTVIGRPARPSPFQVAYDKGKARADDEKADERNRQASRLVMSAAGEKRGIRCTIEQSRVSRDPRRIAFLVQATPSRFESSLESWFVQDGQVAGPRHPDWFHWDTLPPEVMAESWAERAGPGGTFKVREILQRTEEPPTMTALVVQEQTGRRFTFKLLPNPVNDYPNLDMIPIDP